MIRRFLSTARRALNVARGRDFYVRPDISIPNERFGSDYGGWHVASNTLAANAIVYSFGLGEDASFDLELIKRFDVTVHCFDPTPKSLAWAAKQGFPTQLVIHGIGLADYDGEATFHPPANPNNVSHTMLNRQASEAQDIVVPVCRLETLMNQLNHQNIDLLKMDIEGAEYAVIEDLEKTKIRPKQLLIEFHHRFEGVGSCSVKGCTPALEEIGLQVFSCCGIRGRV